MRSAGLKNITAKHLGECQQCPTNIKINSSELQSVETCTHFTYSTGIAIALSHRGSHPIHSRSDQKASRSETSCHVD